MTYQMTRLEMDPATSRWHVRARSISECVEKLGQVWTMASEQAEQGDQQDRANVRVRMRTSVLTLVVIAPRPETAERALAAINALHQRHPSRAIVVSPSDPDGPSTMDAHIYAECQLSDHSGSEMCTEQILIKTGGELSQHLSRVVTPLLIHDLPVVLWWPDDPPFGSKQFNEVVGTADRLLVDSGAFHEDGGKRLRRTRRPAMRRPTGRASSARARRRRTRACRASGQASRMTSSPARATRAIRDCRSK